MAWTLIVLACALVVIAQIMDLRGKKAAGAKGDRLGTLLMEMQSKYMVGASTMQSSAALYPAAEDALNKGPISQRQRFIILAAELAGTNEAAAKLKELDELIDQEQQRRHDDTPLMSLEESFVQYSLHALYLPQEQSQNPPLTDDVRDGMLAIGVHVGDELGVDPDMLVTELGWFGELALTHADPSNLALRNKVLRPAKIVAWLLLGGTILAAVAALLGFAGLITVFILLVLGKLRRELESTDVHHGIYAEAFALWMILLIGLQFPAAVISKSFPTLEMTIGLLMFLASLSALLWPVIRGVTWRQVRQDIGWTLGRLPHLEPLFGVAGYLMALPVLAAGLGLTLLLMYIQKEMTLPGPIFDPVGGPSHPIIEQLGGPQWMPKVTVLFLAAVAAPVVEETMFRGVLYRHLRGATNWLGLTVSIIVATLVNSFIFALIHPQGWVAIPALMSLAIAFSLMREWRGTLVPCMIMHGMSNFIIISLLIVAFSA